MNIIKKIVSVLKNRTKSLFNTKFRRRILKRQKIYWKKSNDNHKIYEKLYASSSMAEWRDMKNWQRRLENKLNAKEFASKFDCRVAKLYWNGKKEDFLRFDFRSLPENYVLKPIAEYSSRNVYVMHNRKNLLTGKYYESNEELKKEVTKLFSATSDLEMMIEEFIPDENSSIQVANDYKFYMFNGQLAFIKKDERTSLRYDKVSFYTENWELIDKKILTFASVENASEKPKHLPEMIDAAKRLSKVYKTFVRIDFYESPDGPVFGEFTPTPRGGVSFTKYGSKLLIKYWDTFCKGMI